MTAPYVLDECPLWGDLPMAPDSRYLIIPSLQDDLYSRKYGSTIYGRDVPPLWTISTTAYKGSTAFDFWMASSVSFITRAAALIQFTLIVTKRVSTAGWIGKSVDLSTRGGAEAHFLVYSCELDVSLDLHLAMLGTRRQLRLKGVEILREIQVQ